MFLRDWARLQIKSREAWAIFDNLHGWCRSFIEQKPVDAAGEPIPWYTYPAIEYLNSFDFMNCRVFEYGCGNSSLFWSNRAREVVAVEVDEHWARIIRSKNFKNLNVIVAPNKSEYLLTPIQVGGCFDLVVIDGHHRTDCVVHALDVIDDNGLIILDNSDWYSDASALLRESGRLQVDFSGMGPINPYAWTTSLFIRAETKIKRNNGPAPIGGLKLDLR